MWTIPPSVMQCSVFDSLFIYRKSYLFLLLIRQIFTNQTKVYKPDKVLLTRQSFTNQTKFYKPDKLCSQMSCLSCLLLTIYLDEILPITLCYCQTLHIFTTDEITQPLSKDGPCIFSMQLKHSFYIFAPRAWNFLQVHISSLECTWKEKVTWDTFQWPLTVINS